MSIKGKLPDFSDVHMVVIGDVMIDRYISGEVRRISPEAPVPVVEMTHAFSRLGGAANVALNLHALGARVTLLSVVGDDAEGEQLEKMLGEFSRISSRLRKTSNRKTTVKTRIMAANQHLLRIDVEDTHEIEDTVENELLQTLGAVGKVDGVILQDYNKGLLTRKFIRKVMEHAGAQGIPTFVDPKEKHFFDYAGCTVFKPNKKEVYHALSLSQEKAEEAAKKVYDRLQPTLLLMTLGSQGLLVQTKESSTVYPTSKRVIADVCGAGDTVISVASLAYVKGLSMEMLAHLSNLAGGQVCEKPGVVSVDLHQLQREYDSEMNKLPK
jgi:rfaE bifunctional protein kinase chain/domain